MGTKKLIVIIIILIFALAWFTNYAFSKIQAVELEITVSTSDKISASLKEIANELEIIKDIAFIGEITVSDMPILLVDHISNEAVLWQNGSYKNIDYLSLDDHIIKCNSYVVYISNKPTLILNCDSILGDPVERAVVSSYQYLTGYMHSLNPSGTNYFLRIDDDSVRSFYRNQMIEAMMNACFYNENLEEFGYYYNKWSRLLGEERHGISNYDYYDGLEMYLVTKVRSCIDSEFNIETYINSYKNTYGFYSKEDTYSITGLLWFLLAEKKGIDVLVKDDIKTDRYKILLKGVPLSSINDLEEFKQFKVDYTCYINEIKEMISNQSEYCSDIEPTTLNLMSENYDETIQIDQYHYVYINYIARLENLEVIQKDYMLANVKPYKIRYFFDFLD